MKKRSFWLCSLLLMGLAFSQCTDDSDDAGVDQDQEQEQEQDSTQDGDDTTTLSTLPTSEEISSIPRPTLGKRWTLIEELSDEFSGSELDDTKWYDYHPSWQGRPPGLFMSEQISVNGGYLVFEGGKLEAGETVTVKTGYEGKESTKTFTAVDEFVEGTSGAYNIKCAAVVAKSLTASYDTYYECRVKANKTLLSTTFWLSAHNGNVDATGTQPSSIWDGGTYGGELDILECIGRGGDFAGYYFCEGMHSNAHFWFKEGGTGDNLDFRAASSTLTRDDGGIPSDDFNTYGCWWVGKSQAKFYLNNDQNSNIFFTVSTLPSSDYSEYQGAAFAYTEDLGLNLVMETYTWFYETEAGSANGWNDRTQNADGSYNLVLPTDEELTDPSKNRTYYDWVRCYKLKDVAEEIDGTASYVMFDNHIFFYEKPSTRTMTDSAISVTLEYTASKDSEIEFAIYSVDEELLYTQVESALAGFANSSYSIDLTDASLESGVSYYIVARLRPEGSTDNSKAYEGDSFKFTLQ